MSTGLAELTIEAGRLRTVEAVASGTQLGGWIYRSSDGVAKAGDLDGSGRDDLLVRGPAGFAILGHDSGAIRYLGGAAHGDRVGGSWYLQSSDALRAIGDLDGDGRGELLVSSAWGVGLLGLGSDGWMVTLAAHAFGQSMGGWSLSSADAFSASANLDGVPGAELVVRSGWGMGVFTRRSGQLALVAAAPSGASLGGWVSSAQDQIVGAADFDGDGRAELVVRSWWGVGMVGLDSLGRWALIASAPHGGSLGGWFFQASDVVEGIGDFDGDGRADLLVRSGWGIGAVGLDAARAWRVLASHSHGSVLGGWGLSATDRVTAIGDLDGDRRDDFVLRSGWGIGAIGLSPSGFTHRAASPFGAALESWILSATAETIGGANVSGDQRAELIMRSP